MADHPDVRNAIRLLFKPEGLPLVSYASAKECPSAVADKPIGCLLLDVRMAKLGLIVSCRR